MDSHFPFLTCVTPPLCPFPHHILTPPLPPPCSQEAIKLITRQFTPVGGTLIYNGISATTAALEL